MGCKDVCGPPVEGEVRRGAKGGPGGRSGAEVGFDLGRCRLEGSGEVRWGGEADGECVREVSEPAWGDGERSRDIASGKSLQSSELW